MNAVSEAVRPYAEQFRALDGASARAPGWLPVLRRAAFARFADQGFPPARSEDWKYTSTRPLEKRSFTPVPATSDAISSAPLQPVLLRNTATSALIFVNGLYQPTAHSMPHVPGLRITSLESALLNSPAQLEAALASSSVWGNDPFTALNTAFLRDGIVIELDDGVQLDAPLQLVFVSTRQAQALACHPRILLRLGRGARAMLVEAWFGLEGATNFINSYTQIALDEAAQLEHLTLQRESNQEFHVSRIQVAQQCGSRYHSHTFNLGGSWVRTDLHVRLLAPQAEAMLSGLYHVGGTQHVDNHTCIEHLAPQTRSNELYRGIIGGHAHAVFNGKVLVAEHAVKTDAAQSNNNLLLSRQAEIDTKPELEIYADDVKCSHGATVGQLDEDALFYLRSRGLALEQARDLLLGAFALVVLERIASPSLRGFAHRQLATVLPQSAALEPA